METLISSIWTPNINIWQIHVSKKKQNQKKTNTFNKSQKKKPASTTTHPWNSLDLFHSLCRPEKKRHIKNISGNSKTPGRNCWNGFGAEPPSLACQHLEASRWVNRYLRCSVWNRLVCVFCRKVISWWWLEEIRLATELRLLVQYNIYSWCMTGFIHT